MYFPPSQQGQTRLIGAMDGALHAKLVASLVHQLGIVGMMNAIRETRAGIENDRGATLAQLGISHQRSAHGLLKGEDRTKREIMTMSEMATYQGPGRGSHDRNSLFVDVVLLGIFLEEPNGFGAMIHDLEMVPVGVNKERIIDAGEGHSLGMVLQELVFIKHGFVAVIEASPMKVYHQGHGLG